MKIFQEKAKWYRCSSTCEALQPLGQWLWDSFLKPIAEWTGGAIVDTLTCFADALTGVSNWIVNNQELVAGMAVTIGAFAAAWEITSALAWIANGGSLISVITAITSAVWAATGAKIADKAVDLAIIALYAKDYIVAFAGVITKMATATAAWIADTAAKVANTAAQWAQIAATTAWNAICTVATALTTAFGAAVAFLTSPIGLVVVAITALIAIVALMIVYWDEIKMAASKCWNSIVEVWNVVASWFDTNVIQPVGNFFSDMWSGLKNGASDAWEGVKDAFGAVADWFSDIFTDAWEGVKKVFSTGGEIFAGITDGIAETFKTVVNAIIGGINSVIAVPFDTINGVLNKVRGVSVAGIEPFKSLWKRNPLPVPEIPLLAKGAVLPANKPFLAMVGDQKHGTNIEAPLATIQEAVALVMQDQTSAIMAGFEASVGIQREILEAVLGIQIGDDVIGTAVERYNRKRAIMRGSTV